MPDYPPLTLISQGEMLAMLAVQGIHPDSPAGRGALMGTRDLGDYAIVASDIGLPIPAGAGAGVVENVNHGRQPVAAASLFDHAVAAYCGDAPAVSASHVTASVAAPAKTLLDRAADVYCGGAV
ncbi:MAG: hypothetical protein ABI488_23580 [Polyangiaceae bacterium]